MLIGAGAAFAYVQVLSGNLHTGLGNVGQYLVKTNMTKEPFYMLLMGTDGSAERDESGDFGDSYRTDSIMLARIDRWARRSRWCRCIATPWLTWANTA